MPKKNKCPPPESKSLVVLSNKIILNLNEKKEQIKSN